MSHEQVEVFKGLAGPSRRMDRRIYIYIERVGHDDHSYKMW